MLDGDPWLHKLSSLACLSNFVAFHRVQFPLPTLPRPFRPVPGRVPDVPGKSGKSAVSPGTPYSFLAGLLLPPALHGRRRRPTISSSRTGISRRPPVGRSSGAAVTDGSSPCRPAPTGAQPKTISTSSCPDTCATALLQGHSSGRRHSWDRSAQNTSSLRLLLDSPVGNRCHSGSAGSAYFDGRFPVMADSVRKQVG